MATYRVLVGIDYAGKRAEPGTLVDDIPANSLPWLLEQNIIQKADEAQPRPAKPREPQSPSKGEK